MPYVLLVEDSTLLAPLVKAKIESELPFKVLWAKSYADAHDYLETYHGSIQVALIDLYLPDAPYGEIVDFINSHSIPIIVFTGEFNETIREKIWSKGIVDYVVKRGTHNLDYITSIINRIIKNKNVKILIVDDEEPNRHYLQQLLSIHQYYVLEARDGMEALKILQAHPDIKLVLTDYYMPNMNGFELTQKIRQLYRKDSLAIIGLSGRHAGKTLSARFIKSGANDFIDRPFLLEEFYCRVTQNVDIIEQIQMVRESSNRDYLTGLYNRKYFFETGTKLYSAAQRKNISIGIAMLDIDHFKRINDDFGHDAGDTALRSLGSMLNGRFRESDIVARFGGEEFCILFIGANHEELETILEKLRQEIEQTELQFESDSCRLTVSIGYAMTREMIQLDELVSRADKALYTAKRTGRNRVSLAS